VKLAIFDDHRLGAVLADDQTIVDLTGGVPWPHDPDPLGAGWWVRLCRDFDQLRPRLEAAVADGPRQPLGSVRLRPPVLNPTKIIACAVNYAEHVDEMRDAVLPRVSGKVQAWMLDFDVFLKAPSSIVGPEDSILLPAGPTVDGKEIHHEAELTLVVSRGGASIAEADALDHVLGYTIGLDITVRGEGDRSRRKSYDTFTPLGPWLTTRDEVPDPHALDVELSIDGEIRQRANTADMTVRIPGIIAYASSVMRLEPGDAILTGAPQGVGQIHDGEVIHTTITRLGEMRLPVRRET